MRLLLVEDSARLRELVGDTVRAAGWRLDALGGVEDAEEALATTSYDLILLDLGLPDGDGIDLLKALRARKDTTPVLVITARGAVDERIVGLDAGADDYLAKPFNKGELLARARALLRRAPMVVQPVLEAGRLRFDLAAQEVSCEGRCVPLAPRERAVLEMLMRNLDRVVMKKKIEEAMSEFGDEVSPNAIEIVVSRLRSKLSDFDAGVAIETLRGVGYLLREPAR
jgi:two-component system response regulator TctD